MINVAAPGIDPNALLIDFEVKTLNGLVPLFFYYLLPADATVTTSGDFELFETMHGSRRVLGCTPPAGLSSNPEEREHMREACAAVYRLEVADKL